ncbi:hypothetical protein E2C01_012991 [Portunus trituberculatus]|uniref:Uncharacterized protein n=1 Tax=Portunus trituberculatus TaxID=210409 RepID=A0A5B7DF51_PORTR|nr:hypothetical protein [Portunus trituberculatus]
MGPISETDSLGHNTSVRPSAGHSVSHFNGNNKHSPGRDKAVATQPRSPHTYSDIRAKEQRSKGRSHGSLVYSMHKVKYKIVSGIYPPPTHAHLSITALNASGTIHGGAVGNLFICGATSIKMRRDFSPPPLTFSLSLPASLTSVSDLAPILVSAAKKTGRVESLLRAFSDLKTAGVKFGMMPSLPLGCFLNL